MVHADYAAPVFSIEVLYEIKKVQKAFLLLLSLLYIIGQY